MTKEEYIKFANALKNNYTIDFDKLPEFCDMAISALSENKGEWIKIKSGNKDFPESIVCSKCKNENSHLDFNEHGEPIGKVFVTSKFCPNCGAKMKGGDVNQYRDERAKRDRFYMQASLIAPNREYIINILNTERQEEDGKKA